MARLHEVQIGALSIDRLAPVVGGEFVGDRHLAQYADLLRRVVAPEHAPV